MKLWHPHSSSCRLGHWLACGLLLLVFITGIASQDAQDMVTINHSPPPPRKRPPPSTSSSSVDVVMNSGSGGTDAMPNSETRTADVIVIGAGMSGLAAGWKLKDYGNRVIVLEGRSRIGGRVMTAGMQTIRGAVVDLGANFLLYNGGNPVADYAKQNNISTLESDITETVYDGMRPLSEKEGKTAIDAWTAFMEDLKKTQEKKPEPPPDVPMSKFLEVFLKEFGVSAQYQPGMYHQIIREIEMQYGTTLANLGYRYFNYRDSYKASGGNNFVPGGMYQIINKLAQAQDIRLNRTVTRIRWNGTQVQVSTKDGAVFVARSVICTLPLGVLKSGSVQFSPPLPKNKTEAISKLGVGLQDKIVLAFDKKFWTDTVFFDRLPTITGVPVVTDTPIDEIDGIDVVIQDNDAVVPTEEVEVEMVSKSASTQTAAAASPPSAETPPASRMASVASNNVSGVTVVTANTTNVTVDVAWTGSQYLYQNFWNARWQTGAPILVVNNYGADAWKAESRKDIDQVADALFSLRSIYGMNVTVPKEAIITKWGQDPFARGSTSYFPNGTTPEDMDQLATPEVNLFFAGEHTISKFHNTLHGAYLSGLQTADLLMTLNMGRQISPPMSPNAPPQPRYGASAGSKNSLVNGTTLRTGNGAAGLAVRQPGAGLLALALSWLAVAAAAVLTAWH